jgi:hypothetical protein
MKTFTEDQFALSVIGIGVGGIVLALVVQSDGFNSAEKTVGGGVSEGLGLGLLFLIVAVSVVLL